MSAIQTKRPLKTSARDNHGHAYEVFLKRASDGRFTLHLGGAAGGSWYLDTLLKGRTDRLAIDFGQGWYVENMLAVLAEAEEIAAVPASAPAREKVALPQTLQGAMGLWREGLGPMPKAYIDFHMKLAQEALEELRGQGFRLHRTWEEGDGWMDGMIVVYAIVEKDSRLFKIHWNDANQEFFAQHEAGGSSPLASFF